MNAQPETFPSDWKAFIDGFPDHIARYDADYKHLYINRAIENEIQLPASEVIGKSNRDLKIPNDEKSLNELEKSIRYVFQTGLPGHYFTRHTFPQGTRYYYMKLIPGFLDGTTQVESVWAVTREITTLKEYEQKLRKSRRVLKRKNRQLDQANANLDTFFYTVSHDLRNPLANLKAAVSLLKKKKHAELAPFIEILDQSTGRLDEILTGLTEVIELGNKQERAGNWTFDAILSTVRAEFGEQLSGPDVGIVADFSACPAVSYVKPYLESLFRNTISNALKYQSPDRALRLMVTSFRKDGYVVITFEDNGVGIDLDRTGGKIFKPFYQVDPGREGKGMGLHIVKNMLEKNGGKIEVASQPQRGTTFAAYLKEY